MPWLLLKKRERGPGLGLGHVGAGLGGRAPCVVEGRDGRPRVDRDLVLLGLDDVREQGLDRCDDDRGGEVEEDVAALHRDDGNESRLVPGHRLELGSLLVEGLELLAADHAEDVEEQGVEHRCLAGADRHDVGRAGDEGDRVALGEGFHESRLDFAFDVPGELLHRGEASQRLVEVADRGAAVVEVVREEFPEPRVLGGLDDHVIDQAGLEAVPVEVELVDLLVVEGEGVELLGHALGVEFGLGRDDQNPDLPRELGGDLLHDPDDQDGLAGVLVEPDLAVGEDGGNEFLEGRGVASHLFTCVV